MLKLESDILKFLKNFSDEFVTNANCDVENVPMGILQLSFLFDHSI